MTTPRPPTGNPGTRLPVRGRLAAAVQLGYALIFGGLLLVPNLRASPNLVLIAAGVLTALWILGCAGAMRGFPRSAEIMLCGAAAPVLVGLIQLVYRITFLATHGMAGVHASGTVAGFAIGWILEIGLVLLPGTVFLWRNAKSLPPVTSRP